MSETNQRIIIFLAAFVLLVVLLLGWPTPYRYAVLLRSMGCGGDGGCTVIVRVNRITGYTQWNDGRGWFPKDAPETPPADPFNKH